jgi:hypothetical protein
MGTKADPQQAMTLYRRRCDAGHIDGCVSVAEQLRRGSGATRDLAKARTLFVDACGKKDLRACTGQSLIDLEEKRDMPTALARLRTSCSGGEPFACTTLAQVYEKAIPGFVPPDFAKARTLAGDGCRLHDAAGCVAFGFYHSHGLGGPQDLAEAARLYRLGCDHSAPLGCTNLGLLYEHGRGMPPDRGTALALFREGCDEGDPGGCTEAANMLLADPSQSAAAVPLLIRACDGGEQLGCSNLGTLYFDGDGVPKDEARAADLFERSCAAGNAFGCANLGRAFDEGRGRPRNAATARELFETGCRGGIAPACARIGTQP